VFVRKHRKIVYFGLHDHSCVFLFTHPLPLAAAITAVVPRRRRDADASAVVRRAGSLSRDGNLHAGIGPPSTHFRSVSVCCVLLSAFALVSVRLQFDEIVKIVRKKAQKHQKILKNAG
jgi:hypothetical protein